MSAHKSKKRKGSADHEHYISNKGQDTSKPSAIYNPTKGRLHTLSIALPGSIIANAQKPDQKAALAGQIARACAVFCVDEIIVFHDGQSPPRPPERNGYTAYKDPDFFLYHVLSYLETPPHLRKALFPIHPDLEAAGALPSLDMPHHLRGDESSAYREGISMRPGKGKKGESGTFVDCGLRQHVFVPVETEKNTRITLKITDPSNVSDFLEAEAVSPDAPREEGGYYWGYTVRQASSLSDVFTECPFDGGYDISIGTSERGKNVASIFGSESGHTIPPSWNHLLVVFGGVAGLETAFSADPQLRSAGVREASEVFDHWINLVPGQGSRTIRTEEAVWVGLTALRPFVQRRTTAG